MKRQEAVKTPIEREEYLKRYSKSGNTSNAGTVPKADWLDFVTENRIVVRKFFIEDGTRKLHHSTRRGPYKLAGNFDLLVWDSSIEDWKRTNSVKWKLLIGDYKVGESIG